MLTKEQVRARYFAVYLHCKTTHTNFATCQLLLRSLSAITDEDVAVFGRMFYPKGWDRNTEEVQAFKDYLSFGGLYYAIHECVCSSHDLWLMIYDMLRSMGYYTGNFMGYDPIAEGWAIVDDKNVL